MPKRTSPRKTKKNEPTFGEILTPALPLTPAVAQTDIRPSRLISYGSIALLSILAGLGIGLALRTIVYPVTAVTATPGLVAQVTNPAIQRVLDAKVLTLPVASSFNLQAVEVDDLSRSVIAVPKPNQATASANDNLQPSISIDGYQQQPGLNAFQPGYSAYGLQGSVGIVRVR